jgi:hypothetical protein
MNMRIMAAMVMMFVVVRVMPVLGMTMLIAMVAARHSLPGGWVGMHRVLLGFQTVSTLLPWECQADSGERSAPRRSRRSRRAQHARNRQAEPAATAIPRREIGISFSEQRRISPCRPLLSIEGGRHGAEVQLWQVPQHAPWDGSPDGALCVWTGV